MNSVKGFVSFIFIFLCAIAVFLIGWVQLYVPVEHYGVLVSKTNGVDPDVILDGSFSWKWQKLIPTNTVIHTFEAKSEKKICTVSGKLPSADIYSALVEGRPDFSYSFTFEIEASVKPDALPELVKAGKAFNDEDVSAIILKASNDVAEKAVSVILDEIASADGPLVSELPDESRLLESVRDIAASSGVSVISMKVLSYRIPDVALYNIAKNIYTAYLDGVKDSLLETTGEQIGLASDDFLLIERFGKLGQVLTDYPILIDYLAVTHDDPDGALGLLDSLKNRREE